MVIFNKISTNANRILSCIGGAFLVGMILLTCTNIFCRFVWIPVRGTFELMGFFGAVVTAFSLGTTQIRRGHISVDVLINTFSPKIRRLLNVLNSLICMFFFAVVAWQISQKASTLLTTGEVTETLRFPYYPFTYGVALGCLALCFVFGVDLVQALFSQKEGEQ